MSRVVYHNNGSFFILNIILVIVSYISSSLFEVSNDYSKL